ncbi:MAG: GNAT family N-acetyltransferase [Dysgonamonadaceae bacterium]|jgi:diamine N-acetyltransferase|nr:GNAT family N-acetyltransferase [Dysgonamonadaceae bacterium]
MKLLENDTIILRALEPEDLDVLYKWENDSELWHYGVTLSPYSKFTLRNYIANSDPDIYQTRQLRLMIEKKADEKAIGTIDLFDFDPLNLRAGIGILLDGNYRNQGFGSQALRLMEEYAFSFLMLNQLYAYIPRNNTPSYRLFCKNGYIENGLLKSWIKTENEFTDVYFMQLMTSTIRNH